MTARPCHKAAVLFRQLMRFRNGAPSGTEWLDAAWKQSPAMSSARCKALTVGFYQMRLAASAKMNELRTALRFAATCVVGLLPLPKSEHLGSEVVCREDGTFQRAAFLTGAGS